MKSRYARAKSLILHVESRASVDWSSVGRIIDLWEGRMVPLVRSISGKRLEDLESRARNGALPPIASLGNFYRIELNRNAGFRSEVAEELGRQPGVSACFREYAASGAEIGRSKLGNEECSAPPLIASLRMHKAWSRRGGDGKSAAFVDVEGGWARDKCCYNLLYPNPLWGRSLYPSDKIHGAKTLSVLMGRNQRMDYSGIVPGIWSRLRLASYVNESDSCDTTNAILAAVDAVERFPGAILLLEVTRGACHRSTPASSLPTEIFEPDFHAIRLASSLGFIVIQAAGNGSAGRGVDLDTSTEIKAAAERGRLDWRECRHFCRGAREFRDSGAIVVGALNGGDGTGDLVVDSYPMAATSNRGSRIDCWAYGTNVMTPGILGDDSWMSFHGTSAASAIIAGMIASCQSMRIASGESPVDPLLARQSLRHASVRTGDSRHRVLRMDEIMDLLL